MTSIKTPTWDTGMREVAPGVYAYIQAKGSWFWSNAGLVVGHDYAVVIDSLATIALTQQFLQQIRRITDKPLRYLINTHHHGDHIWGNHLFQESTAICHDRCRQSLLDTALYDPNVLNMIWPEFDFHGIQANAPLLTFDQALTLWLDDQEVRLLHLGPAHTAGDTIVYLPQSKVVFAGDLLFYRSTPVGFEACISAWIDALQQMSNLDAHIFVPGHGPLCDALGLVDSRNYLVRLRDHTRACFNHHKTAYEAARTFDLGDYREWVNRERALINVERLYSEFRGDPLHTELDRAALLGQMQKLLEDWTSDLPGTDI